MFKQITSIVLLLLANIVLLAHDVIPHHHHENDICFENHACADSHSHESETQDQPSEDDTCCLLAEMVVFTPSTQSFKISCPCCEIDQYQDTIDFSFIPTYAFTGFILSDQFLFRQYPYRIPFLLSPADQIHGLRAPPVA